MKKIKYIQMEEVIFTDKFYKIMCVPSFISRIEWRTMLEWLDPKEGERILDVACGEGQLSLKIAETERGCEVCGIDKRSENAIRIARYLAKRLKIAAEFEVGNAEDLPYRDSYFDNYYTPELLKERFGIAGFEMNRNKYLLNSRITSFFFNFGIKKNGHFIYGRRSLLSYILYVWYQKGYLVIKI